MSEQDRKRAEEVKRYRATEDWEEWPDGAFIRFEDFAFALAQARREGVEAMRDWLERESYEWGSLVSASLIRMTVSDAARLLAKEEGR